MDNNFVKQIDYIAIYPNKKYSNYNNAFIIIKDSNEHPFVVYAEKINNNISISQVEDYMAVMGKKLINIEKSMTLEMEIYPDDNKKAYFKIIDLDPPEPPKEMTKKEIEELLGYKIKIVE